LLRKNSSMRVLEISLRADYGGGPRHVYNLLNGLSGPIDLYIACPKDYPHWELYKEKVSEDRILALPHRKFSAFYLLKLTHFIHKHKIDLIHSHGKGAGLYSRLLKVLTGKIVIHTFHGIHYLQYSKILRKFYLLYEKLFSYLTDAFISVSNGEKKQAISFLRISSNKITVIYNGVEALNCNHGILPDGLNQDDFIIAHISRFDYAKNTEECLKIVEILASQEDVKLMIMGDGPNRPKLETLAKQRGLSNVFFLGFVNPNDYLSSCKLYLSTSRWEGLPLAPIEAMSLGIPIIASNVIGNDEVVLSEKNGFLYELGNYKQAAQYIMELYKDYDKYSELSNGAKEVFFEKFTIDIMIKQTAELYEIAFSRLKGLLNESRQRTH
jgi:glycosyltransferase involved in cell wall biosynthesis